APLVSTYVAGPFPPGDVCYGIPWRFGSAPAATPTSAGSPPHPPTARRADAPAAPLPRAPSSGALFSPTAAVATPGTTAPAGTRPCGGGVPHEKWTRS